MRGLYTIDRVKKEEFLKTAFSKAQRLMQLESIILNYPGIKRSELSKLIGVHKSTISRYIYELSRLYPLTEDINGGLSFWAGSCLDVITDNWINHNVVRLEYSSPNYQELRTYEVGIIKILPNHMAGTFVILTYQFSEKKIHLFRIDRIIKVSSIPKKFKVSDSLEIDSNLDEAWSILHEEEVPVKVILKFSSKVAERVKESSWYSFLKITDLDNGELLAEFEISEPVEIDPWIRGWGIDVEILEPEYLRQRFSG